MILFRRYHQDTSKYPRCDNYDAIEVSKVVEIPCGYDGISIKIYKRVFIRKIAGFI